jgi:uncharacterized membrane protein
MDRSRGFVLTGAAIWCLLILAAPIFQLQSVYLFFSTICHQNPLRSWALAGEPLPVCIRCACIYFGLFIGILLTARTNFWLLKIASALTLTEFVLARVLIDSALLRGITGVLLGYAVAPFMELGIKQMLQMRLRRGAV